MHVISLILSKMSLLVVLPGGKRVYYSVSTQPATVVMQLVYSVYRKKWSYVTLSQHLHNIDNYYTVFCRHLAQTL